MVAVETICSVELLTPEIMSGNAHGSCTRNRIWRFVKPMPRAAPTASGSAV